MFATVVEATGDVEIAKEAELLPDKTVTEAGTTTAPLSLTRLTTMPLVPALPISLAIPDEIPPAVTGLTVAEGTPRVAGFTSRVYHADLLGERDEIPVRV
jgi:hypothetical protein